MLLLAGTCLRIYSFVYCHDCYFQCLFTFETSISGDGKQGLFAINASSGVISLNGSLDRELREEYRLRVLVNILLSFLPLSLLPHSCYLGRTSKLQASFTMNSNCMNIDSINWS